MKKATPWTPTIVSSRPAYRFLLGGRGAVGGLGVKAPSLLLRVLCNADSDNTTSFQVNIIRTTGST